ncbi:MAG TPA: SemiSWEET transporter [Gammaproteobacteria bacterium]|nr:SemiSWEET transporter [Gammaproteobacteria bacterium]
MTLLDLLGLSAGSLTTISFVPQVIKTWRSKSADDISTGMFAIFSLGLIMWLIYGLYLQSLPIIISNIVTLLLTLIILVLKFRYSLNRDI